VQPTGQRGALADGGRLEGQQEEGRLEDVFRVVPTAEGAPPDGQDRGPVAAQQGGEGVVIAALDEAPEEVGVARLLRRPGGGQRTNQS
jgi:hypothetical protein